MRPKENYSWMVSLGLVFTLAILVSFQAYIFREPSRIANDEESERSANIIAGNSLFVIYCTVCHGTDGEGISAPALNEKSFLASTSDERIFSVIGSGVPETEMPAWSQRFGGPLTDQQINQIVAFLRSWETTAPDLGELTRKSNREQGLIIFNSTCAICHGVNGLGSSRAPALNDADKLSKYDDAWYAETIANGRPSQGMPTWGTVLSPTEIYDIVALFRWWQNGATPNTGNP